MYFQTLEPMIIYGDGIYSLNGIQEITGTDSFMSMDQTISGCQTREHVGDCATRKFQESIVQECGCSPIFSNFSKPEVYWLRLPSGQATMANLIYITLISLCRDPK